jgi:hypothetical protein
VLSRREGYMERQLCISAKVINWNETRRYCVVGLGFVMRISVMFLWFLLRGDISHHRTIVGYIRGRCFVLLFVFSLSFFLYATSVFILLAKARKELPDS